VERWQAESEKGVGDSPGREVAGPSRTGSPLALGAPEKQGPAETVLGAPKAG